MPTTRVLHIHITGIDAAPDDDSVQPNCDINVGISDASPIGDSYSPTITLKLLGVYKTAIQMNISVADACKDFLSSSYSIPTNGYAAVYVTGAYGLLSIL